MGLLWHSYSQIFTYFTAKIVIDFMMAGDCGCFLFFTIHIYCVSRALSKKFTSTILKMAEPIYALHVEMVPKGSFINTFPLSSSSINCRLASRTNSIASLRFSFTSYNVSPWAFAPGSSSTYPIYPSGTFSNTAVKVFFILNLFLSFSFVNLLYHFLKKCL